MIKLSFKNDTETEFYKELRGNVNDYFISNNIKKTGNGKMIAKAVFYLLMAITFYGLMFFSSTIVSFTILYLLFGTTLLLIFFNIGHDAVHSTISTNKRVNNFFLFTSFQLLGKNPFIWRNIHTKSHHLYTNVEGSDVDVMDTFVLRMTKTQKLKWFHKYQHIYVFFVYIFYSINWLVFKEILAIFNYTARTTSIKTPLNERIQLFFFKVVFFCITLIFPAFYTDFSIWEVLSVFVINQFLISLFALAILTVSHLSDYVEHPESINGEVNMSWAKLQLRSCIDFNSDSRLLNFILGGFNTHLIHHFFPEVCHIHYPKLVPIIRETCKKYNCDYMEITYYEALKSHFRFLKKMGTSNPEIPIQYNPVKS